MKETEQLKTLMESMGRLSTLREDDIDSQIINTYDAMMDAHGASDNSYEALDRYSAIYDKYGHEAEYNIDQIIAMCSPAEKQQFLEEIENCFPDTMF